MARSQPEGPWLSELFADLLIGSGVGYIAAAYAASRWLTKPTPRRPSATPSNLGLSWEPATCQTIDRHRLHGWIVTPARPRATVVLFHGVRNTREQALGRMAFLTAAGYRCVAFDHRAHGESTGRKTSFGYHEVRDVLAVLDLVRERWPDQPRAALGISMGAAALCYAAEHAHGFDALILESLYHDITRALTSRMPSYSPWFRRLADGAVWVTERRLGVKVSQLAPVDYVAGLAPVPVFLLTGAADRHAPPEDVRALYARCRGPRELCIVPEAGHNDMVETGGTFYRERVLDFLDRRLAA
jgi:alpha-beta hydrolase superfamily lysophospholipase